MRLFTSQNRITLSRQTELEMFQSELDYYRTNNQYPVELFGHKFINIYKNINLQVVVTRRCNAKCGFCIENDGDGSRECDPTSLFALVMQQYHDQGIFPTVSITGGEPSLYPERVDEIIRIAQKYKALRISLNSNGAKLHRVKEPVLINWSCHHWEPHKIFEVFHTPTKDYSAGNTVQCVLLKGYVDGVDRIKEFISVFPQASGFSFRGLSRLDGCKPYGVELAYTNDKFVDCFEIFNQISLDQEFQFIQQKIGDHYVFEIYRHLPTNKIVRLTYSNFEWLRKVEQEERAKGAWFSRATIVSADGGVYAGWTYDINQIWRIQ